MGKPRRIDSYADAPGVAAAAAREMNWRSSVGVPIIVDGELWGAWPWSQRPTSRCPPTLRHVSPSSSCPSRSTNRASNSLHAPGNDELGWLPGGPSLAGRGRGHALYLRTLVRLLYSARSEPSDQFGCAGVDVKLRRSGSRRSSSGSMLQASVCRSFQSHGICSRTRNSRPYRYSDSARSAGVSSSDSGSRRLFGSSSRSSP
jgi:hypothetical protein